MVNCIWSTFRNEIQWHAVFVFYICAAEPGRIRWQRQVAGRNESSEGIVGEAAVWNLLFPMTNTLASWHLLVLAWHMCKKRMLNSRSLRCWPQGQVWWEHSIFSSVFPLDSQGTWRLMGPVVRVQSPCYFLSSLRAKKSESQVLIFEKDRLSFFQTPLRPLLVGLCSLASTEYGESQGEMFQVPTTQNIFPLAWHRPDPHLD